MDPKTDAPADSAAPIEGEAAPVQEISEADWQKIVAEKEKRSFRRKRVKARDEAEEIKELNITAMMDMMTILLVFLLKSYTSSSTNIQLTPELQIPNSTTHEAPKDAIGIIISQKDITVNDKLAAPVIDGQIPAAHHDNEDMNNPLVVPLLGALQKEVDKQKLIAKFNPAAPFEGKVNIAADKRIPYSTILNVLYTAGQAELSQYKLMAQKTE